MLSNHENNHLLNAPAIPGLTIRVFDGESDYPKILAVIQGSQLVDQIENIDTLDPFAPELCW